MTLDLEKIKRELSSNPGIMLDELAKKIGEAYREYGLSVKDIKKLLQSKTAESLDELKGMLDDSETPNKKQMSSLDIDKLLAVISGAKEFIKNLSKKEIEELKTTLENTLVFHPDDDIFLTTQYLPANLVNRGQNPQHFGDHITGACLGIANSAQMVVELLYKLGKGVLQSPYHIYLLTSGQANYDGWKRV